MKTHSDTLHATKNTLPVSRATRTRSGLTSFASTRGTERSISRYILISYTLLNIPYKSDTLFEHARDRIKYLKTLSGTSYTLLNIPYQSDTLCEYALDWQSTSTHDMTHKWSSSTRILISYTLLNTLYKSDTLREHTRENMKHLETISDILHTAQDALRIWQSIPTEWSTSPLKKRPSPSRPASPTCSLYSRSTRLPPWLVRVCGRGVEGGVWEGRVGEGGIWGERLWSVCLGKFSQKSAVWSVCIGYLGLSWLVRNFASAQYLEFVLLEMYSSSNCFHTRELLKVRAVWVVCVCVCVCLYMHACVCMRVYACVSCVFSNDCHTREVLEVWAVCRSIVCTHELTRKVGVVWIACANVCAWRRGGYSHV